MHYKTLYIYVGVLNMEFEVHTSAKVVWAGGQGTPLTTDNITFLTYGMEVETVFAIWQQ